MIMSRGSINKYAMAIAAVLLLTFSMVACAPDEPYEFNENGSTPPEETAAEEITNETEKKFVQILDRYHASIPALTPGAAASPEDQKDMVDRMILLYDLKAPSQEIHELYEQGITQLSQEQADRFAAYAISGMRRNSFNDYVVLEQYLSEPGFLERFFEEAERVDHKYVELNRDPSAIRDPEVKKIIEEAGRQGYFIASAEGMLYYLVDFTVFAKYREYHTEPMASLIETLAIDNLDPMASDAALIISREAIAARAYNMEKMLADYKGTTYEKYLAIRFRDHMRILFFGTDNTPAFSYDTNLMNDATAELLGRIATMEDSFMARLTGEYMTLIESNGGKMDDAVRLEAAAILEAIDVKYDLTEQAMDDYGRWLSGEL